MVANGIEVVLNRGERFFAAQAGVIRRLGAMAKDRNHTYGKPRLDLWGLDIEAAGAEAAVARVLTRYWVPTVGELDTQCGDVSGIDVRSTTRLDGKLILHDADIDDRPYVLVRGVFPRYRVEGWCYGRDGKQEKYRFNGDGRPAYFVPVSDLRDIKELA